jgi:predicted Fe-Mo cluster-binding NifX family protein
MKIAISTDDKQTISNIFGRAKFILIYENKQLVKTIKNPFLYGGGGAGIGMAKLIEKENVNKVVGGKFGPKVEEALKNNNIIFKIKEGDIEQCLDQEG